MVVEQPPTPKVSPPMEEHYQSKRVATPRQHTEKTCKSQAFEEATIAEFVEELEELNKEALNVSHTIPLEGSVGSKRKTPTRSESC